MKVTNQTLSRIAVGVGAVFIVGTITTTILAVNNAPAGSTPSQATSAPALTYSPAPVITPTAEPVAPTPEPNAPPMTDEEGEAATTAAENAVIAIVAQPSGETPDQRASRLAPLFAPGSTSPTDPPALTSDGITDHAVTPGPIEWTEPYDDGTTIGLLIAVQAISTGLVDGTTPWTDTSSQMWQVTLTRTDAGQWMPLTAIPANRD